MPAAEPNLDSQLAELMRRAQAGDRQAYDLVLRRAEALVRLFVRKRLHDAQHEDDVVQETLLSIHKHRHTYDPDRVFTPWMYSIARHRLVDSIRRQRKRREYEVPADTDSSSSIDGALERRRLAGLLQHVLARISETQRQIIHKLKIDGYSVAEIARDTGRSETLVKVTAHRGYNNLRKLLAGEAYDE